MLLLSTEPSGGLEGQYYWIEGGDMRFDSLERYIENAVLNFLLLCPG